ncbi:MAG: hypothetical protein JXR89_10180 [Deltaproteobacteria bacterium]|nr:hypothetical protein [Deltaproteobacteria bacterium]
MVVGYWHGHGYPERYPGDAATQTAAIDQLIASGGEINAPNPAGSEGNCEDYGLPRDDNAGPLLEDAYLTAGRAAHADNCIADWMLTSRSDAACGASPGMRYGWSCSNAICPAFIDYVASRSSTYFATTNDHRWMDAGIDWDDNWDVLKAEIDAGRPMVFLVDSSGDGSTDHFVAIVGYRLNNGQREYGCKDTWNQATRWERFREMSNAYSWGIGYAFTFSLRSGDGDGKWYVNAAYAGVEEGSLARPFNTLGEAVFAAAEGDVIYVKDGLVDYTTLVEKSVLLLKY